MNQYIKCITSWAKSIGDKLEDGSDCWLTYKQLLKATLDWYHTYIIMMVSF